MTQTRREFLIQAAAGAAALSGAARSLGQVSAPEGMILIPAGPFLMGTTPDQVAQWADENGYHPSWLSGETPQKEITLPEFAIDRFPVTNEQYARFCSATSRNAPPHWGGSSPSQSILDHPVVYITRPDALAYASWAGKRLATEAEWEKAARGTDGRVFPWGNDFNPDACHWNRDNAGEGPPTPTALETMDNDWDPSRADDNPRAASVSSHPAGASPYGVMDMIGNVAEWCVDPVGVVAGIKGGCWLTSKTINLRAAARNMTGWDTNISPFNGFRCAKDL